MGLEASAARGVSDTVADLWRALGPDDVRTAALRPALSRLDFAVSLPNAAAPGFVYLAGAVCGQPVGGGGRDLVAAAGRLAGEASEVLAQAETASAADGLAVDARIGAIWGAGPALAATDLGDGSVVGVPIASVFPGRAGSPGAPPRSLGLAAGPDRRSARMAGLLELVERDAAAAWWRGEIRPRALDAASASAATAALAALRAGAPHGGRPTGFLVLPSVTGLPVICALSRDARGGRGLAFGLKAALDPTSAALGATMELLQMEIGLEITRLRAARGQSTPEDAGPLALAALDPDAFAAFAALPPAGETSAPPDGFDDLLGRLRAVGVDVVMLDLAGLPGGLAVAKAFAPGLRPMPGPGPAPRPDAPGAVAALM